MEPNYWRPPPPKLDSETATPNPSFPALTSPEKASAPPPFTTPDSTIFLRILNPSSGGDGNEILRRLETKLDKIAAVEKEKDFPKKGFTPYELYVKTNPGLLSGNAKAPSSSSLFQFWRRQPRDQRRFSRLPARLGAFSTAMGQSGPAQRPASSSSTSSSSSSTNKGQRLTLPPVVSNKRATGGARRPRSPRATLLLPRDVAADVRSIVTSGSKADRKWERGKEKRDEVKEDDEEDKVSESATDEMTSECFDDDDDDEVNDESQSLTELSSKPSSRGSHITGRHYAPRPKEIPLTEEEIRRRRRRRSKAERRRNPGRRQDDADADDESRPHQRLVVVVVDGNNDDDEEDDDATGGAVERRNKKSRRMAESETNEHRRSEEEEEEQEEEEEEEEERGTAGGGAAAEKAASIRSSESVFIAAPTPERSEEDVQCRGFANTPLPPIPLSPHSSLALSLPPHESFPFLPPPLPPPPPLPSGTGADGESTVLKPRRFFVPIFPTLTTASEWRRDRHFSRILPTASLQSLLARRPPTRGVDGSVPATSLPFVANLVDPTTQLRVGTGVGRRRKCRRDRGNGADPPFPPFVKIDLRPVVTDQEPAPDCGTEEPDPDPEPALIELKLDSSLEFRYDGVTDDDNDDDAIAAVAGASAESGAARDAARSRDIYRGQKNAFRPGRVKRTKAQSKAVSPRVPNDEARSNERII